MKRRITGILNARRFHRRTNRVFVFDSRNARYTLSIRSVATKSSATRITIAPIFSVPLIRYFSVQYEASNRAVCESAIRIPLLRSGLMKLRDGGGVYCTALGKRTFGTGNHAHTMVPHAVIPDFKIN